MIKEKTVAPFLDFSFLKFPFHIKGNLIIEFDQGNFVLSKIAKLIYINAG